MRHAPLALLLCLALLPAAAQEAAAPEPAAAEPAATEAAAAPAQPRWPAVGEANSRLSDRIPPQQQLWLQTGADRFFVRMLPDLTGTPRGAVLILHDAGQHPSWPFTVAALFDTLPLHGWHTLALELPGPGSAPLAPVEASPSPAEEPATETAATGESLTEQLSALEQQVQARIDTTLGQLTAAEGAPSFVALIAFGHSAPRAAQALLRRPEAQPFRALVLVDAANEIAGVPALPHLLPLSDVPVEDILQSEDRLALTAQNERWRATLYQRERTYRTAQLPPLNSSKPGVLIKRIRGFLQSTQTIDQGAAATSPSRSPTVP